MIRLRPGVSIPISGALGFDVSDAHDCTAYLFEFETGWALFDAGAGIRSGDIASRLAGLPGRGSVLLTHAHADHAGGAAAFQEIGATLIAGAETAARVASGDEALISLDVARRAGIYPADYGFRRCEVDQVLADGESVALGPLRITAIATPGHSRDHISYLVEGMAPAALIAGDAVFHNGRVALQSTWDCDIQALCGSLRRLAALEFEMFLPGHGNFSLTRGRRHVQAALSAIDQLLMPPPL